ncbi:hypothetical protein [Verrucosispora sioxanthis]|uniref:Uncharacterized protein n=1 Tax=Verrucosispora sioxanthis TaxID=2499994 RepID=A0A6M1L1T3_9ACTN|nr:hypothetical protein [Verrucosispora sioxanthis]NEE63121.1 hypothetical protein [Verrucosispora sioxanthis]NGM12231.1 hypothetical protein [Verrucosispora sioxanthis]
MRSDDDIGLVERVQQELRAVRWLDTAEVRAVARRRSRFRAAAVTVGVVVLSIPLVTAVALPSRPPTVPGETGAISRAEIPFEALLQPEDLRVEVDAPIVNAGLAEPIVVDPELARCLQAKGVSPAWEMSRYSRSQSMRRPQDVRIEDGMALGSGISIVLSQDVYRITPQVAQTLFASLDRRIGNCLSWESVVVGAIDDMAEWVEFHAVQHWEVVDRQFAGDESVLIRHRVGETRRGDADGEVLAGPTPPDIIAVVRVGDLVTVVDVEAGESESELRRLAVLAAGRMCAATNPPC